MAATATFSPAPNSSTAPAIHPQFGRRARHAAGRRAAGVDGSLRVGYTSRGGLKASPSWSPAYLLAALEWAEKKDNGDNNNNNNSINLNTKHNNTNERGNRPAAVPLQLARKTASNLPPKRATDDVNWKAARRTAAAPLRAVQRMDSFQVPLPEKLVLPSRRTPASFLPTPSSVSLDAAVKKPLSPSPGPQIHTSHTHIHTHARPVSPGTRSQHRAQQQPRPRQQPPRRSEDLGDRPWHDQREPALWANEVAQLGGEIDRRLPVHGSEHEEGKIRGKQTMYQTMQPSATAPPPPLAASQLSSSPRQSPQAEAGAVRETFGFFSRGRKKSNTGDSPRSTLTKRSRTLPTSSTSTSSSDPYGAEPSLSLQSLGIGSDGNMSRTLSETQSTNGKVSASSSVKPITFSCFLC